MSTFGQVTTPADIATSVVNVRETRVVGMGSDGSGVLPFVTTTVIRVSVFTEECQVNAVPVQVVTLPGGVNWTAVEGKDEGGSDATVGELEDDGLPELEELLLVNGWVGVGEPCAELIAVLEGPAVSLSPVSDDPCFDSTTPAPKASKAMQTLLRMFSCLHSGFSHLGLQETLVGAPRCTVEKGGAGGRNTGGCEIPLHWAKE